MNISLFPTIALAATLIAAPSFAQSPTTSPGAASIPSDSPRTSITQPLSTTATTTGSPVAAAPGQPGDAEMMAKMMELAKPGENHKVLADLAGTWSYKVKMWMVPGTPPQESTGTAMRKATMGGRYFTGDFTGKMEMPGADGKKKSMEFRGMSVEGYDNVKQKFVSSWIDNMGTGIMMSEGTYDPATKTFNYTGDYEPMPGMKCKIREVIKIADKDHHTFEFYEDRGQGEAKTMEINYTRKK
jgi:hypothetical protein